MGNLTITKENFLRARPSSINRFDEGLTLETSAFSRTLYGGQFTPLTQLKIVNFPVIEALAYLQTNFLRQHLRKFIENSMDRFL